jgi:hypothetical protein
MHIHFLYVDVDLAECVEPEIFDTLSNAQIIV